MLPFATEFPWKRIDNKAAFVSEIVAWLSGMRVSTILASTAEREFEGDNVHIVSGSGEELRIRALQDDGAWRATAFRHDLPDEEDRIWRTEAVLKRAPDDGAVDLLRLRTQCLPQRPGAILLSPRKPFLIKSLLNGGWGGDDGEFTVVDVPRWLDEREDDLMRAELLVSGDATTSLPVVYVPAVGHAEWIVDRFQIEKLAYDLGGVAHVVVEPSRQFSYRLRDLSGGRNVYGGTIELALPSRGFVSRFFVGPQYRDVAELIEGLRRTVTAVRGQMPTRGWDWTDFQEHVLRSQRAAIRGSAEEAERLLDGFTARLEERADEIRRLKAELASRMEAESGVTRVDAAPGVGPLGAVEEIYEGETLDRVRYAAVTALKAADANGIDERSKSVWRQIADEVPRSPALDELLSDLDRATKNPKRLAAEVSGLLKRHGYEEKSENRHVRLQARAGLSGLSNVTLPKTPSDGRGLKNLREQLEETLGIGRLPKAP